jgi:hypothetical protein
MSGECSTHRREIHTTYFRRPEVRRPLRRLQVLKCGETGLDHLAQDRD